MDNHYQLADIAKKEEVINQISQYEEELSKTIGNDIILIAYARDKHGIAY